MTFDKQMDNKFEVEVKSDEKSKKHSKKKRITFKKFIETFYNKEEKTFFSRTFKDWVLLFIFFIFFYFFLFGYFALLLFIFISGILTPNVPFRTGANSLLGASPSITFRPVMDNGSSTLILTNDIKNATGFTNYVNFTGLYLNSVIPAAQPPGISCPDTFVQKDINSPCIFNKTQLENCLDYEKQLKEGRVCLFLRINNLYGWLPSIQNATGSKDILISCSGLNADDNKSMGPLAYYPSFELNGIKYGVFKNFYFPFVNQSVYWSPIVAVHFLNITTKVLTKFTCKAANVNNILATSTIQLSMTKV